MFNINAKRVSQTGKIELKNADDSPLLDDAGNQLTVTVHGPGSKIWQAADADMNRKRAERMRKAGGKIEAALDNARPDQVEFLTRVTISFDGWDYPAAEKEGWGTPQDMFRAAYADLEIGFIFEHMLTEARNWANFTKASATN